MRRYSSAVVERKLANVMEAGFKTTKSFEKQQEEQVQKPSILLLGSQNDENASQSDGSFDFEPLNLVGDHCFVKPI